MTSGRTRLLAGAGLAAAALAATATRIRSNDVWWHLATGRWILETGLVPRTDPFSFTSAGTPWVDHGWLWQVAAFLLEGATGIAWIALMKMLSASVFAVAAFTALGRAGWGAHQGALLVLACLAGSRFRFADRPEAAGLALLALFLFFLVDRRLSRPARLAGAGGVTVVWANVHASALLAPVMAGAAAAGGLLAFLLTSARREAGAPPLARRAVDHALTGVLAAACLLANPYGFRLLQVPFRLEGILETGAYVNPEWPPPSVELFPFFWASLAAVLAVAALRVARRVDASTWGGLLMAGAGAYLAVGSIRHVGIFFVTVPFAAAASGLPGIRPHRPGAPVGSRRALLSLVPRAWAPLWGVAAAVLFATVPAGSVGSPGFGREKGRFPVSETDWVENHLPPPRAMYNDVAHGGYLIWRLFPGDRVFIDGRNEVHAGLLAETAAAVNDGRAWQRMLNRHGIQAALVRYRPDRIKVSGAGEGIEKTWAPLHFPRRLWALVHWGDTAMIYVRRDGRFQEIIDQFEYPAVEPENWEHQLSLVAAGDEELRSGILRDVLRRLAQESPSARAEELVHAFTGPPDP